MRNSQDINESSEDFHDEVPLSLNRMTSWGGNINGDMIPPRMLRGYESKLKKINFALFLVLIFFVITIIIMAVKLVFFTQFEIEIFDDGTDMICIYNPETGEIKQNGK